MNASPQGPKWKRVVVKLSGEALQGGLTHGLDSGTLDRIADDLAAAAELGTEIAVVVGGGNFFRGIRGAEKGIERARADSIGMLATVMNALAMEHAIEKRGRAARALSAVAMPSRVPALFASGGAASPRQGPDRDSRRRHRKSVLHHRHRRGPARRGTVVRRHHEGDPGGRRLFRRPEEGPDRDPLRAV